MYFHIPQAQTRQVAAYIWSSAILAPTGISIMDMTIDIHGLAGTIITVIVIHPDFDTGPIIRIGIFTDLLLAFIIMAPTNGGQIGMIGIEDNFKPD
ncbi:MAG: hypothetical protein PHY16_18050 [Methylobacter sp.]|nr:hypothetical protein [Methylobacter sp.]